jgi:hypothetical protein
MTRSVKALSVEAIQARREDAADRFVDLQFTITEVVLTAGVVAADQSGAPVIASVGGRWDRIAARFVDEPAAREVTVPIHAGQRHVMAWLIFWLSRYLAADRAANAAEAWPEGENRPYSALWVSGRRAGKSWLAVLTSLLFAVARPRSLVWLCAPTEEKTEELRRVLGGDGSPDELIPPAWGRYRKDDLAFALANGSEIRMKSAHKSIKEGRADLVVLNEGQLMIEKRYQEARGAIVDSGGMVIVTANPPDDAKGEWIERMAFEIEAGDRPHTVMHRFDAKLNPFIDQTALESLAETMDEVTADREIGGVFRPIGDVVYHQFRFKRHAQRPAGPRWTEVTRDHTRALFGRAYDVVVSCDFDKLPHLAAVVWRVYRDSAHPGIAVAWVVAECIVPKSDENGLLDALEDLADPRDGSRLVTARTAIVIADSSGRHQDTARNPHNDSWDYFEARGYRVAYPHPHEKRNPRVSDRNKVVNAALRTTAGVTRLYLDPACRGAIEGLRKWEMKGGAPFMKSRYAHIAAAVGYGAYRLLFGDLKPHGGPAGYRGKSQSRATRALRRLT